MKNWNDFQSLARTRALFVSRATKIGVLLLAFASMCTVQPSIVMAQGDGPQFGYLHQRQVPLDSGGSNYCVPTAIANAMPAFMQKFPRIADTPEKQLVLKGDDAQARATDIERLKLTARRLAELMKTTEAQGTGWEEGRQGLEEFLKERKLDRDIQVVAKRDLTGKDLTDGLQEGVVVILVNRINAPTALSHALTLTSLQVLKKDATVAELTFVDPMSGDGEWANQGNAAVKHFFDHPFGLRSDYYKDNGDWNAHIWGMYAIIPRPQDGATPEPSTWLLGLTGLAGVIGSQTWRKRYLKAPV